MNNQCLMCIITINIQIGIMGCCCFHSIIYLALLSRRLTGELTEYSCSVVCSCHRTQCSNISSERAGPIKAKYFMWNTLRKGEPKFE